MDCVETQIKEYLKSKKTVEIYYNNETGRQQYSVQVVGTDFWLDAFPSQSEAIAYCEFHGLPYTIVELAAAIGATLADRLQPDRRQRQKAGKGIK